MKINNKIILVTGANRGIGLETCRQLCDLGHTVILGSRGLDKGKVAANKIDNKLSVIKLDVTSEDDVLQAAKRIENQYGRLDVLVNNAAIGVGKGGALDANLLEVQQIMEVNFYGAWRVAQMMVPLLRKSKDGRILNVTSSMGLLDQLMEGYAGYRLSKTALNGLTILLSNELEGRVKVNAIDPGWVQTDMGGAGAPLAVNQGADTIVWLATIEDIPTGKVFCNRKEINW